MPARSRNRRRPPRHAPIPSLADRVVARAASPDADIHDLAPDLLKVLRRARHSDEVATDLVVQASPEVALGLADACIALDPYFVEGSGRRVVGAHGIP